MEREQQLTLFMRRVNELRGRRLFKQGGPINISRETEDPPQISVQIRFPDEEDLRSFLLIFGQFVSQDAPVFVRKIYNLCFRALEPGDPLRELLAAWLQNWTQTGRQQTVGITLGDSSIPPGELANLWINGYYFHNDADKYERLKQLYGNLTPARVNLHIYLMNATRAIDHLGHLVAEGMHKNAFRF